MSELRIEVGRATVIAEAVELRHASADGVAPLYSVADLLNAAVRCLRAIGTDEAAEAIDRLTAEPSELEHPGDAPGTFDGVRVPLELAPGGYVHLSQDDLRRAAVLVLEGSAVDPVETPELIPGSIVLVDGQRHRVGALAPSGRPSGGGTYDVRLYRLEP